MNLQPNSPTRALGVNMALMPLRLRVPPGLQDRITRFINRQLQLDKLKRKLEEKQVDIEKQDAKAFPHPPAVPGTTDPPTVTLPPMWFRDP